MQFEGVTIVDIGEVLAKSWRLLALRGLFQLAFGLFALFRPGIALSALVLLFGAFALVDGVFTIVWAIANRTAERHWVTLLGGGVLGVMVGVLTFVMPQVTAVALVYLIAVWATVVGVSEISAAVRLRKLLKNEWVLIVAGVLSIAFALLLVFFPRAGALGLVLWIGAYAAVIGVLLIVLAFRLRSWGRTHHHTVGAPRTA